MKQISITNREDDIISVLHFIQENLRKSGFSHNFIVFIAITLDEILSNIIHHGYEDDKSHSITVKIEIRNNTLFLIFEDDGIPFNPLLHHAKVSTDVPLSHRKIGGLGIYLVRQIMDSADYKRIDGKNILTLVKTEEREKVALS